MTSEINLKLASIVNPTADTFHHCLHALLDKHSPIISKHFQVHTYSPWYTGISDMLKVAEMERRKAERHWLTSGLTVHKEIYVASKKKVSKIVHDAKLAYFSSKLQIAQTANSFFMSLINSWEDINHHVFLPQFLLTVFLVNFLLIFMIK